MLTTGFYYILAFLYIDTKSLIVVPQDRFTAKRESIFREIVGLTHQNFQDNLYVRIVTRVLQNLFQNLCVQSNISMEIPKYHQSSWQRDIE